MTSRRILLHICCAPCATTPIRRLQDSGYDVLGYFYNPNIHPEKEYYQRLLEVQRLCRLWQISLELGEYDWDRWQAEVRGLESEPEAGRRCPVCFRFRLQATAELALARNVPEITTTLTLSPRKRAEIINLIGQEVCAATGDEEGENAIRFYPADWKKQDGHKQSLEVSRQLNLYRQDYCGCRYSLAQREERRRQSLFAPKPELAPPAKHPSPTHETKVAEPLPGPTDRARWELTPLERKQRRDKKPKPWARR
ncbi:MAG: epoxyqueuosine reductase QueH [candidate division WOR-3 bacterium]